MLDMEVCLKGKFTLYATLRSCLVVFHVCILLLPGSLSAPTNVQIYRDVIHIQEHIKVIKLGATDPLINKYRKERYSDDPSVIGDLEQWGQTTYSKGVKDLPEIASHMDLSTQLTELLHLSHENVARMTLWMRHIASQESLHEHGANYMRNFLEIEQMLGQLMLRFELMAQNAGLEPITLQIKDMQLNNPPEFSSTTLRRHHHYVQLFQLKLLLSEINERFIPLEAGVINSVFR